MKKRLTSILSALLLGLFVATAVVGSVIMPAYAAEQTSTQEQPQEPSKEKKDNTSGHSRHHG